MTEPLRVLVVGAPKTGNHMLVAAIQDSYGPANRVEVGYNLQTRGWPTWRSWVVSTHDPYSEELQRAADDRGVRIIGLDRHIAGHLLSFLGDNFDVENIDFNALSRSQFAYARYLVRLIPDRLRVSYDSLADPNFPGHTSERQRVADILGLPVPVRIPTWRSATSSFKTDCCTPETHCSFGHSPGNWVGQPHRWRELFTDSQVATLYQILDNPKYPRGICGWLYRWKTYAGTGSTP